MRVLVVESEPGVADDVVGAFEDAGHTVMQCHEPGEPGFPCFAMQRGRKCPIDDSFLNVAIAVDGGRRPAEGSNVGLEGARCAVRRNIPLVVAGPSPSAFSPWAMRTCPVEPATSAVDAAEPVAASPLMRPSVAATRELKAILTAHGYDATKAIASVTRTDEGLSIRLEPGVSVHDRRVTETMSVRALAAVRTTHTDAARISVTIDPD